jgi:hypothetical protein
MRLVLAVVAAAATAALGAVIIGEYQLAGITGVIAGTLFGLAIAEVVLTVSGPSARDLLAVALGSTAVITVAGLLWAAWISSGHDWGFVPTGLWIGLAAGAVVSVWWVRSGVRRGIGRPASEDA